MTSISIQNLTYRFDNGDTLFADLNFTLDDKITGLIGRNGAGKSFLAALLAGEKSPYSGSVTQFRSIGWLRQIGVEEKLFQYKTISDFLGIKDKLQALGRITEGGCDPHDFELIGDNWLLRKHIEQQLQSLGLPTNPFLPCQALSGGQLTRLALHYLFQSNYDYLILDEPSNHLDKQGKIWLIEQMQLFSGGILIISHDRNILRYVDDILELNNLGVRHYGGAYEVYAEQRATELVSQERRIEHAKTQIKQMNQAIQKNREKAQQRASQGKQLARSGSQAKILLNNKKHSAEHAGGSKENNHSRQLAQVQDRLRILNKQHETLKPQSLSLGKSEKRVSRILDVIAVHLPYLSKENDITFFVEFGDKVHLSGTNGSGKSTLLKAIAGQLQPNQGDIQVRARICYLDQHFTLLVNTKSAQENLSVLCPHLTETDQRTLLAGIGLRRERANQEVATLSGGEKMKVAMLAISHQLGDVLLLLDEPDNHLDLNSKQMLAQSLHNFTGSLLVVSHDQDFIEDIGITGEICLDM
ncbi:ATP-binding cassette domain-containing protein [Photorhabdus laumondii]|uniref:ATP-binding cassette domain-containing protein n=1 Tax=Photorhabdus laumondii TaxID=2218628 RepID=UPI0025B01924|nr:ATP-binding cassette domain-containing protein [Photorhabdus laumondii]